MGRWEPNARGRLEQAAFDLFAERGFDQTTVAEIAERAGLTKRSLFRHFADKRDILFAGAERLQDVVTESVAAAPPDSSPLAAVRAGLAAATELIAERGPSVVARQAILDANPELRERELMKMARLAAGIAEALRARGVADRTASLTADTGVAAFKVAFEYWVLDTEQDLARAVEDTLAELKAIVAEG
ncbi:TetR/AcrR family transcriptional regulator [Nocardia acidivorans]|uniref:TetR/AcrR family transcriptional regulator n=1 Tax=Nocardia acidivorans TaxID=404580 RepID=UPI000835B604|nr:TetR/AcrR family transcriptional regulator [Nocardia acidivorans]